VALHALIAVVAFLLGGGIMGFAAVAGRAEERAAFAKELLRRAEVERQLAAALRAGGRPCDRTGDA
jgi:hypothetical protein